MKKIVYLLSAFAIVFAFSSCEKKPDAAFEYFTVLNGDTIKSPTQISVGQTVFFKTLGEGTDFSVWTGDDLHDYSKKSEVLVADSSLLDLKQSGIAMSKTGGNYVGSYAYTKRGSYSVVVVSRIVSNFGKDVQEAISTPITISVSDNSNAIKALMAQSLYPKGSPKEKEDVVVPSKMVGDSLITVLPYEYIAYGETHMMYSIDCGTATASLNGTTLSSKFELDVDPSKRVGLTLAVGDIVVTSLEGTTKKYVMAISYGLPSSEAGISSLAVYKKNQSKYGIASMKDSKISMILPFGVDTTLIDSVALFGYAAKIEGGSAKIIVADPKISVKAQSGKIAKTYSDFVFTYQNANVGSKFFFKGLDYLPISTVTDVDTVKFTITAGNIDATKLNPVFDIQSLSTVTALKIGVDGADVVVSSVASVDFVKNSSILFQIKNGKAIKFARVTLEKK